MLVKDNKQQTKTERVNVRFPKELMDELRKCVPAGKRSELIVEATAKKLAQLRTQEAIRLSAGAWTDENHPDLNTPEDIERYLAELRAPTNERIRRLANLSA